MQELKERKSALRKKIISQRQKMDVLIKRAADAEIYKLIRPYLDAADGVFTYASTDIEVDTRRIIDYCLENGIPTALPVSGDSELGFYYISSADELKKGRFGIDEPPRERPARFTEKTVCIVPALCADGLGYRLGYGRGYYDRFLNRFTGKSVIICYRDFQMEVPVEEHDVRADITIFDG